MQANLSEEEALTSLVQGLETDIRAQLTPWLGNTNIFDVLGIAGAEIRHSNFLAWLLNPATQPVLKDAFVKQILLKLIASGQRLPPSLTALNVMLGDFGDMTVERERDHMDIFMQSQNERLVLVFENKLLTGQHDNQLHRYERLAHAAASDQSRIVLVYLTINGDDPEDEAWLALSFADIYAIITELLPELPVGRERYYVADYLETLRVNVLNDDELTQTVREIYSKYKPGLDLIMQHIPDETTTIHDDFVQVLNDYQKAGQQISVVAPDGGHTYIRFRTAAMDHLFAGVRDMGPAVNSWNAGSPYFWEIKVVKGSRLMMNLSFHVSNQTPAVVARMNSFLLANGETVLKNGAVWHGTKKKWYPKFASGLQLPEEIVYDDSYTPANVQRVITDLLTQSAKVVVPA